MDELELRRHSAEALSALRRQLREEAQALEARIVETSAPFDHPDEPESEGGLGVGEPRRPKPSGLSGAAAPPASGSDEDA